MPAVTASVITTTAAADAAAHRIAMIAYDVTDAASGVVAANAAYVAAFPVAKAGVAAKGAYDVTLAEGGSHADAMAAYSETMALCLAS